MPHNTVKPAKLLGASHMIGRLFSLEMEGRLCRIIVGLELSENNRLKQGRNVVGIPRSIKHTGECF